VNVHQGKTPKPKRHHYVPRFYLDYFASEVSPGRRLLWAYDKAGGAPRPQTPKDTAVESNFYTVDTITGRTVAIEESFSELETAAAAVLKRLQDPGAELVESDILVLTEFLAMLHVRGPRMVQVSEEFLAAYALHVVEDAAVDPALIRRFLQDKRSELTKERKAVPSENELREILQKTDEQCDVVVNRQAALLEGLKAAEVIAPILYQMNWCLCRVSRNKAFITSDSPLCAFVRTSEKGILFGTGFDRPNFQIIFPISPQAAILIDRVHNQRCLTAGEAQVRDANRLMAWYAQRFVYSNVRSQATADLVRRASSTRSKPKLDRKVVKKFLAARKRAQQVPKNSAD
jgi:Protein of unknown function (DUF4238)